MRAWRLRARALALPCPPRAGQQDACEQLKEAAPPWPSWPIPPPSHRTSGGRPRAHARHAVARVSLLLTDLKDMRRLKTGSTGNLHPAGRPRRSTRSSPGGPGAGRPADHVTQHAGRPTDVIADADQPHQILTSLIAEATVSQFPQYPARAYRRKRPRAIDQSPLPHVLSRQCHLTQRFCTDRDTANQTVTSVSVEGGGFPRISGQKTSPQRGPTLPLGPVLTPRSAS